MKKITLVVIAAFVLIGFSGISPAKVKADEYLWGKWRCESPETLRGLIINFGSEGRGTLEIANRSNQWWPNPNQQFFYYHIETVLTTNEECPEYIVKMWIPIYSLDLKTMRILFREDGKIELSLEEKEETKLIFSRIRQDL